MGEKREGEREVKTREEGWGKGWRSKNGEKRERKDICRRRRVGSRGGRGWYTRKIVKAN